MYFIHINDFIAANLQKKFMLIACARGERVSKGEKVWKKVCAQEKMYTFGFGFGVKI